jgi:[ribosomal protein S5]-alanine N-acetyltransferase
MKTSTGRIRLNKVSPRDERDFLSAARASRELHKNWVEVPLTARAFRRYAIEMRTRDDIAFLVRHTDTDKLVGVIELQDIFMGNFCNAYVIYYAFAGNDRQGLMTEAMTEVIRIAFDELKLHRLEANIQPENRASRRLAKSCGFRKEGLSPKFLKKGGEWRDHERWALLSTDAL